MLNKAIIISAVLVILYELARLGFGLLKKRGRTNAQKMFQEYIDQWKLELVYTSTDGTKVYSYTNPLEMPANRTISGEIASNQASMNITRESLLDFLGKMKRAGNGGDIVELFGYLDRLEERLTWACEEQTLFNLADCYLVLEGENPDLVSEKFTKRKKQIIESDPLAKGFFLAYALKITSDFGQLSDSDILSYLETKKQEEAIPRTDQK